MHNVTVEYDLPVPMRDGVTLRADLYRPATPGRYPVLLCRTPYGKGAPPLQLLNPLQAARAGYLVVVQDTRGRFASEGEFGFWRTQPDEAPDGFDTLGWAAALPDSDGTAGMFGLSYLGRTQWKAAGLRPPALRAIAPVQTAVDFVQGTGYRGGAFELGFCLSWHLNQSLDLLARRVAAGRAPEATRLATMRTVAAAIDGLAADGYRALPLADLEHLREVGLSDLLRYLLESGPVGIPASWSADLPASQVPALLVGGWHDCHLQGTLDSYTTLRRLGRPTRLIVGPWAHGNYGARSTMMGDVDYGLAASGGSIGLRSDLASIHLRWFDHWLKGEDNGIDREAPVTVFVKGTNRWIDLPEWPPAQAREERFFLQPGGGLSGTSPVGSGGASHYTYDPQDPAPTLGGSTLLPATYAAGVKDQRPLARRADVLTFVGDALRQPLTVMGRVAARLWVSSSAPDTDFVARLLDVHPDGYLENVCDGIVRCRYRNSLQTPEWLDPGGRYALAIDLWSTAHQFKPRHRLGLMVTSSSFPRWDRNWNTREVLAWATDGQTAEQTIWHGAAHPSCLLLPTVDI